MTKDEEKKEERQVSRRQLLKAGVGVIGAGLAIGEGPVFGAEQPSASATALPSANESMVGAKFEPRDVVRVGIIGVGGRGTGMLGNFLALEHVQVNAICDVVKDKAVHAQEM